MQLAILILCLSLALIAADGPKQNPPAPAAQPPKPKPVPVIPPEIREEFWQANAAHSAAVAETLRRSVAMQEAQAKVVASCGPDHTPEVQGKLQCVPKK